eukprot:549958-Pyramimonas_sp.AAC.1
MAASCAGSFGIAPPAAAPTRGAAHQKHDATHVAGDVALDALARSRGESECRDRLARWWLPLAARPRITDRC